MDDNDQIGTKIKQIALDKSSSEQENKNIKEESIERKLISGKQNKGISTDMSMADLEFLLGK